MNKTETIEAGDLLILDWGSPIGSEHALVVDICSAEEPISYTLCFIESNNEYAFERWYDSDIASTLMAVHKPQRDFK